MYSNAHRVSASKRVYCQSPTRTNDDQWKGWLNRPSFLKHCCALSFCEAEGVAVEFEERRSGEYGSYRRKERRITLNAALPATEKATTLAHELAHHLLHARAGRTAKQTREIEAEGAAFVVCAAFGLDTSRFTFAYVANYAGEPETLKAALERIQGAARRLIGAVEISMEGRRS